MLGLGVGITIIVARTRAIGTGVTEIVVGALAVAIALNAWSGFAGGGLFLTLLAGCGLVAVGVWEVVHARRLTAGDPPLPPPPVA